ncbi:MAG: hypothetical protein JNL58_26410 [Planctomyces sp.]|nr:hypothetical protein [Planctomyces sp.]
MASQSRQPADLGCYASQERAVNYMPRVESMNPVANAPLGEQHTVILFDQIKSAGHVEYTFLIAVFDNTSEQPVYFVASEVNSTAQTRGGGSHYLGVFDGNGHSNLGSSDDWGDPKKFFPEAIRIAAEAFGVDLSET